MIALGWFTHIPWTQVAAFLACVWYGFQMYDRWKAKKNKN